MFSWRCCILKFYCSKLYFEILFLSIFLLSALPFLTKCEYASKYVRTKKVMVGIQANVFMKIANI